MKLTSKVGNATKKIFNNVKAKRAYNKKVKTADKKLIKDTVRTVKRDNKLTRKVNKVSKKSNFAKAASDIIAGKQVDTTKLVAQPVKHAKAAIKGVFPTRNQQLNKLTADLTSADPVRRAQAGQQYTENVNNRRANAENNRSIKRIVAKEGVRGASSVAAMHALGVATKDEEPEFSTAG